MIFLQDFNHLTEPLKTPMEWIANSVVERPVGAIEHWLVEPDKGWDVTFSGRRKYEIFLKDETYWLFLGGGRPSYHRFLSTSYGYKEPTVGVSDGNPQTGSMDEMLEYIAAYEAQCVFWDNVGNFMNLLDIPDRETQVEQSVDVLVPQLTYDARFTVAVNLVIAELQAEISAANTTTVKALSPAH